MTWKYLRDIFGRRQLEQDLDEEIKAHLALDIQRRTDQGQSPDEARREALRDLRSVAYVKEATREAWGWSFLAQLSQDVRYALRAFGRAPGFTIVTVLTLALAMGATTAVFSVVHSVLLKPLPYTEPERLVVIWAGHIEDPERSKVFAPYADFEDWEQNSRSFEHLAAATWAVSDLVLTGRGPARDVSVIPVSSNFFSLLGTDPGLGRTSPPDDLGAGCRVVVSNEFWREVLNSDVDVIGQVLDLDGRGCTVQGVMPANFEFFPVGTEVWSLGFDDASIPESVAIFGRLERDITTESAQAELTAFHQQLHQTGTPWADYVPILYPLQQEFTWLAGRNLGSSLWILFAAVTTVLLIACLNVANLFLGRALMRRKEISVRSALGARRTRLIRQLLTEGLLLSSTATSVGLLLAFGAVRYFGVLRPVELPPGAEATIGGEVLGFAAALAAVTVLLFGLAPAWKSTRIDLVEAMGRGSRGVVGHFSVQRASKILVVGEITLSLVLLITAGLLTESVLRMANTPLGYDPEGLWELAFRLRGDEYAMPGMRVQFYENVLGEARTVPGVVGASLSKAVLGGNTVGTLAVDGRPEPRLGSVIPDIVQDSVTSDYFRVKGLSLQRGRSFEAADRADSPPVAIINEALARKYFPNEDPIGRRVKYPGRDAEAPWVEIVGIVSSEKSAFLFDEMSWVETPYLFRSVNQTAPAQVALLVRVNEDAAGTISEVRRRAVAIDMDVRIAGPMSARSRVDRDLAYPRFRAVLHAGFASLAMMLALVGLYAVLSQQVAQRTHELGIRMALGANRRQVLLSVLRQAVGLAGLGIVVGILIASAVTKYLEAMLFDLSPLEPTTFLGVSIVFGVIVVLAAYIPARRATKVDPMVALRYD